jgi:hypothetical protein
MPLADPFDSTVPPSAEPEKASSGIAGVGAIRILSPQQRRQFERDLARVARMESWRSSQERRLAATRAATEKLREERVRRHALFSARVAPDGQIHWPDAIHTRYASQIRVITACRAQGDRNGWRAGCDALLTTLRSDLRTEKLSGFSPSGYLEARYFLEWIKSNPPLPTDESVVVLDTR